MLSPEDVDPEIVANALEAMETTAPINYQAMELEDLARIILASASERLGRDLERMRGQRREVRGLAKELSRQLTATYRERAHLVALLTVLYPSVIILDGDPDAPGWALVYIDSPTGQLSWHLSADDLDLFPHVKRVETSAVTWDSHTTDEKYGRIRQLTADLATFPLPEPRRSNAEQQLALLHEGEPPPEDENVQLSPAQWIWRWNRATPQVRLEVARQVRRATDDRDRYELVLRQIGARCACHVDCTGCSSAIARRALGDKR